MPGEMADPPSIEVQRTDVEQFLSRFSVHVTDDGGTSTHTVTLSGADWERLGKPFRSPDDLVRASFAYLLAREPKEQILASFDLSQISTYFPGWERELAPPA
jgi:hypothetical protein